MAHLLVGSRQICITGPRVQHDACHILFAASKLQGHCLSQGVEGCLAGPACVGQHLMQDPNGAPASRGPQASTESMPAQRAGSHPSQPHLSAGRQQANTVSQVYL